MTISAEVMLNSNLSYKEIVSIETEKAFFELAQKLGMLSNQLKNLSVQSKMAMEIINTSLPVIPPAEQGKDFYSLSSQLPAMNNIVDCPEDGCKHNSKLWNAVQHLNDHHRWTRESIADWVDLLPFDTSFESKNPDRA